MPAQPQWLLRLPEIIDELAGVEAPVIDRPVIERVFGVKRRRAIHLLGWFGGYQVGRTFVVERQALLTQLRAIVGGERFGFEKRRHARLAEDLERARKQRAATRVAIPVSREAAGEMAGLPSGVRIEAGRLTVEFGGVEELLGKLYAIAQMAAADFSGFEATVRGPG